MPDIHIPKLALLFLRETPSVQSLLLSLLKILLEQAQLMPEHDPFVWIHAQLYAQPICQSGPTASHQSLHFSAGIGKPDVKCIFPEYFMGSTERLSQYGSGLSLVQLVKMNCFISIPQMPG